MRVVFFTSEYEFGVKSLASLINQGENIIATVIPQGTEENPRAQKIANLAKENGIPVHYFKSIKNPETVQQIKDWQPDLGVSAGNKKWVFTREVMDSFTKGLINYHCSKLPVNGGQFPIHWQIYKGLSEIGITIHHVEEGIDTGDIILQECVPVGPDDTAKGIYFGSVLDKSVEMLSKAVQLIREGNSPRTPQDFSQASYNPPFGMTQATINWEHPAQQVYNTIRACDGWPGATTTFRGETFKIWQGKRLDKVVDGMEPGSIIEITDKGIVVACQDGCVVFERVQWGDASKAMAVEFVKDHNVKVGEVFGK